MQRSSERNRPTRGDYASRICISTQVHHSKHILSKERRQIWTWECPDGKIRNQIDYILSSQRGIIQDCEVFTRVDIGSDHRMVRAKVPTPQQKNLPDLDLSRKRKRERLTSSSCKRIDKISSWNFTIALWMHSDMHGRSRARWKVWTHLWYSVYIIVAVA